MALLGLETCSPGVIDGSVQFKSEPYVILPLKDLPAYLDRKQGRVEKRTAAWQRSVYRYMKPHLGRHISIILQDAHKTLNPFLRIEDQLQEMFLRSFPHKNGLGKLRFRRRNRKHRQHPWRQEALRLLRSLHFRDPERVLRAYPHQLSGGMAQRVSLALALAGRPEFIILDEPTTGLDVTLQAALVDLIKKLKRERNLSGIIVSHDLMFVAKVTEKMAIMFSGELWELGSTRNVLHPEFPWKHPYTRYLISFARKQRQATPGPGFQNVLWQAPSRGCSLRKFCPVYRQLPQVPFRRKCEEISPNMVPVFTDHHIRCWQYAWEVKEHAADY